MPERNKNFHVGLKAFIRRGNRLLILRESDRYRSGGAWELPGGRINPKEGKKPLKDILAREVREECGRKLKIGIGKVILVWRRLTHPDAPVFLVGFDCRYRSGEVTLSEEHIDAAWIEKKDIKKYNFAEGYKAAIQEYFKQAR